MSRQQMLMELIEESKKYLSDKNVSELINKEESISEIGTISSLCNFKLYVKFSEINHSLITNLVENGLQLSTGEYIPVKIINDSSFKRNNSVSVDEEWINNQFNNLSTEERFKK